jgi:hypothetical protein
MKNFEEKSGKQLDAPAWTMNNTANVNPYPGNKIENANNNPEIETTKEIQILNTEPIIWHKHMLHSFEETILKIETQRALIEFMQPWFPDRKPDFVLNSLISEVEQRKLQTSQYLNNGFAWLAMGIAILSLPLNTDRHLAVKIIAYSLAAFGCLKMIHGWVNRKRNRIILKKLNQLIQSNV